MTTLNPTTPPVTLTKKRKKQKLVPWRRIVQVSFALINILIGIQFYRFVSAASNTTEGSLPTRPPGVEGWLPISGLMGMLDWLHSGTLNTIHPAATMLVLTFVAIAFFLRKAFCSWLCPVGLLSEYLAKLGKKIFKQNIRPPRWLDYGLMSLKYILLGLFLFAFLVMGFEGMSGFIKSPYNKISDVKMLLFFAEIGAVGAGVLIFLAVGSVFIQGFWCRYFCPYGALLGFFSWLSPAKVRRNVHSCIDCGKCDRVCPSHLPVMTTLNVINVECTGCMECVTACPVEDTLNFGTQNTKLSPYKMAILVASLFLLFYFSARGLGLWKSSLTDEEYRYHINNQSKEQYSHPGM